MPYNYNSTLLGGGSASASSGGGVNNGMNFSSMLGMPSPGSLPSTASYGISKQPGSWGSTTATQQQNLATGLGNQGMSNLMAASAALGLPMNYWSSLLSGSPQAAMQASAPAVNSVLAQYDTARQNAANLNPRGGGSTSAMVQAPYAEAGTVANLLSQAQQNAAQGITSNASLLGSLGSTMTGQSQSGLQDVASWISNQQQYGLQKQQQLMQLGESLAGAALGFAGLGGFGGGSGGGAGLENLGGGGFAAGAFNPSQVSSLLGAMNFNPSQLTSLIGAGY